MFCLACQLNSADGIAVTSIAKVIGRTPSFRLSRRRGLRMGVFL